MILVISADVEIRSALINAVSGRDAVMWAASAGEALKHAERASVLLIDLLAPGVAGRELAQLGRPLVVVGAHGPRPTIIGPDRMLKPFTVERLNESLDEATEYTRVKQSRAA